MDSTNITCKSNQFNKKNNNNNYLNSVDSLITNAEHLSLNNLKLVNSCNIINDIVLKSTQFHLNETNKYPLENVKRESLSPATNGEFQTNLSRPESTSPISLHCSPSHQQLPKAKLPMHNFSTNLLSSLEATSVNRQGVTDAMNSGFTNVCNYSDFMRNLAAKYNNNNLQNYNRTPTNTFFENASPPIPTPTPTTTSTATTSTATNWSHKLDIAISPVLAAPPIPHTSYSPAKLATKNANEQMADETIVVEPSVSPFISSLLSTLPFSQTILNPVIDMSGTQALLTLARASKEIDARKSTNYQTEYPKSSNFRDTPSPRSSLATALQQAAHLISPLIFSTQNHQAVISNQSSPMQMCCKNTISKRNSREIDRMTTPLDLTAQATMPKRLKTEPSSSQSSNEEFSQNIYVQSKRKCLSPSGYTDENLTCSTNSTVKINDNRLEIDDNDNDEDDDEEEDLNEQEECSNNDETKSTMANFVRRCQAQSAEVNSWTVDDVCTFISSIDICAEYESHFRNQKIDGSGLPLLTENHLVNSLGMKLGPALKLRTILAKKLGGPCPCVSCTTLIIQQHQKPLIKLKQQKQLSTTTTATPTPTPTPTPTTINNINNNSLQISPKNKSQNNRKNNLINCCKSPSPTTTITTTAQSSSSSTTSITTASPTTPTIRSSTRSIKNTTINKRYKTETADNSVSNNNNNNNNTNNNGNNNNNVENCIDVLVDNSNSSNSSDNNNNNNNNNNNGKNNKMYMEINSPNNTLSS